MSPRSRNLRWITAVTVILAVMFSLGDGGMTGRRASAAPAAGVAAKTTCKMVTKTVKGKKKRVKVCRTVTPTPRPTARPKPTATPTQVVVSTSPNPLSVDLHPDGSHQSSQTVGTAGGNLSAVTADGTRFTLSIPQNALPADTTITLTPLAAVDRLPLSGGLVAAVQLKPEGLLFFQPATLTVTLPQSVPVDRQIGFAAGGDGKDFHLYLTTGTTTAVTLRLVHFSSYGVGQGTMADVVAAGQHAPSSWQGQAEQLSAMQSKAQAAGESSPYKDGAITEALRQTVQVRYQQAVLPHMQQAATSDDEGFVRGAVQDAIAWMRAVQLAGLGFDQEQTALMDLIRKALTHQLDLAKQRCGTKDRTMTYSPVLGWLVDPAGVNKIIEFARDGQLLGFGPPFEDSMANLLRRCRARGFKFGVMTWDVDAGSVHLHWNWSGQICGDDPFGKPWTIGGDYTHTSPTDSGSDQGSTEMTFSAPDTVVAFSGSDWWLTKDSGGKLRMNSRYNISPPVLASADVSEDASCPQPTSTG